MTLSSIVKHHMIINTLVFSHVFRRPEESPHKTGPADCHCCVTPVLRPSRQAHHQPARPAVLETQTDGRQSETDGRQSETDGRQSETDGRQSEIAQRLQVSETTGERPFGMEGELGWPIMQLLYM